MSTTEELILRELQALRTEQAALTRLVAPLVTRKMSRSAQAKAAGVSPSTLWRREKSAQRKLRVEGLA